MKDTGLIFDIQAFSVHDGPGCRTNVFFVGCPLHCSWCANPENFGDKKHIMFADKVCKWENGCRACTKICPRGGLSFGAAGPIVNWNVCNQCTTFECVSVCPNGSLKMCGTEYTVDELMKIIKRDFNHWGLDGGVTFTGGEPLRQGEFLLQVLAECEKSQIHTAIETSGFASEEMFLRVFRYLHFAFIDVKNFDEARHIEGTGVTNRVTLDNIASLKSTGWGGRLILRTPVIGGYNDGRDNARQCIEFMKANDLYEINLLKFHRLGQTKWEQLGLEYAYAQGGDVSMETLRELQALYLDNDICCYLGDDTPF